MRSVIIITLLALRTVIVGFMHAGRWSLVLLLCVIIVIIYISICCVMLCDVYCFFFLFSPQSWYCACHISIWIWGNIIKSKSEFEQFNNHERPITKHFSISHLTIPIFNDPMAMLLLLNWYTRAPSSKMVSPTKQKNNGLQFKWMYIQFTYVYVQKSDRFESSDFNFFV